MAIFVDPLPINGIAWTLGSVVIGLFGYKSWRSYQVTKNPLGPIYAYIGLVFGISFGFFGVPPLFTKDIHTLTHTYFAADICAQIGMLGQARLLWFVGLRHRLPWKAVAIPTLALSTTIIWFEVHTSSVAIDASQNLVLYKDHLLVNVLKSLIYFVIAYPIAYFFIRQGLRRSTLKARTNSIAAGAVFFLIASASIENALFSGGADTRQTAQQNIIVFAIFLFILSVWSWRQGHSSTESQKSPLPRP